MRARHGYRNMSSSIWRRMMTVKDLFHSSSHVLVRKGDSSTWFDNWLGGGSIFDDEEKGRIEDVQINVLFSNLHGWNEELINSQVTGKLRQRVLNNSLFLDEGKDQVVWISETSGLFTTKEAFKQIRRRKGLILSRKHIWNGWLPLKVFIFLWKIINGYVPFLNVLVKFGFCAPSKFSSSDNLDKLDH
ncbi:hypothetical protein ACH5RR_021520 [Cinchona calisaya]|uniref:Reverse transcriptase zinc-binding domain-containing protein n=1 Tax=Cinchona calisaya TaxID=153742 RepID=A0ABD2ZHI3_9GENT